MKAPGSEPSPPTTTTTNRIGPSSAGHVGLRHQRRTGDHAGEAGERGADAEHQHEDAADIVAEMADHVRMGQRRLHDQADARRFSTISSADEDRDRDQPA